MSSTDAQAAETPVVNVTSEFPKSAKSRATDQEITSIFCEVQKEHPRQNELVLYVRAYIKRADSKEAAIASAMALLQATPKRKHVSFNQPPEDLKPDLRCRIRLPENPVFGTRWQVFEASLWNDIADHMEFLLVDATTRMCTVTSDINTTDKKMYETFCALEQ